MPFDGALGFSGDAAQAFGKTAHELNVGDPGVVVPALFQLVYAPATDPGFKRWHARRVEGMPPHVIPSARFCRSLTVPFYRLCRDSAQADRMRPWFSHPKSKVDAWSNAAHWIMQDRKDERRGDRLD